MSCFSKVWHWWLRIYMTIVNIDKKMSTLKNLTVYWRFSIIFYLDWKRDENAGDNVNIMFDCSGLQGGGWPRMGGGGWQRMGGGVDRGWGGGGWQRMGGGVINRTLRGVWPVPIWPWPQYDPWQMSDQLGSCWVWLYAEIGGLYMIMEATSLILYIYIYIYIYVKGCTI